VGGLQCIEEEQYIASHNASNASAHHYARIDMTAHPKSASSATWICVPRNMPANITLGHGVCWNDLQPSCAEWTADVPLHWNDACEDRRYNFSASAEPCGPCEPRLFVFKTCVAETRLEWLACVLYSFVGFELTYTIFSALAEVLRGFKMRETAVRYLLELTPHHGTQSQYQQDTFGMLPKFDLDRMGNIVAWNRMRIVLQTWDSRAFVQEQKPAALVFLLAFGLLATQVYALVLTLHYVDKPDWEGPPIIDQLCEFLLPRRFNYVDEIPSPALTSINIKMLLLQLLGSGLTLLIVWAGVKATSLFEYELPHILLLKKAALQVAGLPTVSSLSYSSDVEMEVWCKCTEGTSLREYLIKHQLHEIVAQVAVRISFH
jgi:hypothetical protein